MTAPAGTGSGRRVADSARLLAAFRHEQSDPDRFYRMLARDTVEVVAEFAPLAGRRVLEVGSGPGDLAEAFREAGARAVATDLSWEELHCRERTLAATVLSDGRVLPFPDGSFDLSVSSNVLEHVPVPLDLVRDMVRVTAPGGIVFVNYTAWFSPWGGHETAPWHYFGAEWALRRYEKVHGEAPKNRYGSGLFRLGVAEFLDDLGTLEGVDPVDAFPRYFPRWTRPILKVPGIREVVTWNLAVVLRRR